MSKKKMMQARKLIEQKDYAAARKVLRSVDHPKAREWEARLDKIAPAAQQAGRATLPLVPIAVGVVLIVVVAVALVLFTNKNPAPAPQIADDPTLPATLAADSPDATAADDNNDKEPILPLDRPPSLPTEFPFPDGGFSEVFDLSDDENINVSVYSDLSYAELENFYREALTVAGYEFLDFSSSSAMILSFLGNGTKGNVRLTEDGPNGETRITVEMEATSATSLEDLAPGNSEVVASDIHFDRPEAAAEAFLAALGEGDSVTALALICEANKVDFDEATYLAMLPSASVPGGRLDVSQLNYEVIEQDGDIAQVSIDGEMIVIVTANDINTEFPIPLDEPIIMELHLMEGWQICTL